MPNTDPDPQTVALPPREAAVQLARKRFGFEGLRPGQLEAIDAVLSGQDVLVVMPTGAGKSAIYQIAALLLPGPTVVVSPLIALQRDQVLTLRESGAVSAAAANSTVRATDRRAALEDFQDDELELLFLAPEQLANSDTLQALGATNVSLLVVDEAHCISAWGHQFRPEYLRLGALADELGHPRVLALTATATPPVRAEILERLHMRDPVVLVRASTAPTSAWPSARSPRRTPSSPTCSMASPAAPERRCRPPTGGGSTRPPSRRPGPTWPTWTCAAPMICGIPSRPGWRTPPSRLGSLTS
jgi:DEAD/DEAH box helicase